MKNSFLLENPPSERSPTAPECESSNQQTNLQPTIQRRQFYTTAIVAPKANINELLAFPRLQFYEQTHLRYDTSDPTTAEVIGRFNNITQLIPFSKLCSPLLTRVTDWLTRYLYRAWNLSQDIRDLEHGIAVYRIVLYQQ
jgi:hypothetical protein